MNNFWSGVGTYRICFENDETMFDDETEFFAEAEDEVTEFWQDFCAENNLQEDCLIDIEFICSDRI